jgi:hypothetical protein
VFKAYPSLPLAFEQKGIEPPEETMQFDMSLFDEKDAGHGLESISLDDLPEAGGGGGFGSHKQDRIDLDEALGRSAKIEEEVIREDEDRKFSLEMEDEPAAAKEEKPRSRLLTAALAVILIIVAGGAGLYFYAPGLLPISLPGAAQKAEVPDIGVSGLSFGEVNGFFVQTLEGKQRFVISGKITNNYPHPRSFIMIAGALVDNKGQVLSKTNVYAGNSLTEKQLKEMPAEEVTRILKDRNGMEKRNLNLKSGGTVPFMVVFSDLPESMSEFTVEGVSSSRGE